MKQARKHILQSLEDLCSQLNIKLRYEKTSARGGLCRHEGEYKIIIDRKASDEFKIEVIASALKGFDLEGMFISPQLRDLLDIE